MHDLFSLNIFHCLPFFILHFYLKNNGGKNLTRKNRTHQDLRTIKANKNVLLSHNNLVCNILKKNKLSNEIMLLLYRRWMQQNGCLLQIWSQTCLRNDRVTKKVVVVNHLTRDSLSIFPLFLLATALIKITISYAISIPTILLYHVLLNLSAVTR